jgi:hypothetical protein
MLGNLSAFFINLKSVQMAAVVAGIAFLIRVPFALVAPVISPDSQSYLIVAKNIFLNKCVSLSDPVSGECLPNWGGNHLPGYPAFIALFGANVSFVLLMQIAAYSVVCGYLVWAFCRLWEKKVIVWAVGIILAISPLQIGWGRFVLPDLLAHTVFLWVVTELVLSIHRKQLRWFQLGLALVCAVFLRYDGILLTIPVAITGFWLHGVKAALARGLLIAVMIMLPLVSWWGRSVSLGLGMIPEQRFMFDGSYSPDGFRAWIRTWSSSLNQAGNAAYPVANKQYSRIQIDSDAWTKPSEKTQVLEWLRELHQFDGKDFPVYLDNKFKELANIKREERPFHHYVTLTALRATAFWFNPYYSFGLPGIELSERLSADDRRRARVGGLMEKLSIALSYPVATVGKVGLAVYRVVLFGFVIFAVIFVIKNPGNQNRCLFSALLAFGIFKVLLLSFQASVDTRYLLSVFCAVEIFMAYVLARGRSKFQVEARSDAK